MRICQELDILLSHKLEFNWLLIIYVANKVCTPVGKYDARTPSEKIRIQITINPGVHLPERAAI